MGWRNRKAKAALGRAIKHADSLVEILIELHMIANQSELDRDALFFDQATSNVAALLLEVLEVWREWCGELPEDLANRPIVSTLKSLKE